MDPDAAIGQAAPRRGLLIVLSSPSGAGKSTISRLLMQAEPDVAISVSATTRPMRVGERDDVDYNFVNDAQFDQMIADGAFVEWAPSAIIWSNCASLTKL
jgi:guanylate kinase